jgi:hypothetical protein
LRRKFYGESSSAELHQRLLYARDIARRNNKNSTEENQENFNKKAEPHIYQLQQLVLLDEHSFLHKNTKLAPKWSGPHRIIRLKGPVNVELLTNKGKHLLIHVNRIKPYLVPTRSDVKFEDEKIQKSDEKQLQMLPENSEKEKSLDRQSRAQSPLPPLLDRAPLPAPQNFPQPTQMMQPLPPPRGQSPPPVTQLKQRGRLPKPVVSQPRVPPSPVTYALRSCAPLPSTDASPPVPLHLTVRNFSCLNFGAPTHLPMRGEGMMFLQQQQQLTHLKVNKRKLRKSKRNGKSTAVKLGHKFNRKTMHFPVTLTFYSHTKMISFRSKTLKKKNLLSSNSFNLNLKRKKSNKIWKKKTKS